jgi:autotransporter-associated beta strand protein
MNMCFIQRSITIFFFIGCLSDIGSLCQAQIDSTWLLKPTSTDWFLAQNWTAGIPNAPADAARLVILNPGQFTVNLSQSPTIGNLNLFGPGQISLLGSSLMLDNSGLTAASIQTFSPSSGAGVAVTISSPLAVATGEQLAIDVAGSTTVAISGISSNSTNVLKTGTGLLTLTAANPNWDGNLDVAGGEVAVNNAAGLGTANGSTTVRNNGKLTLRAPTSEPLNVNDGTIDIKGFTLSSNIQLSGAASILNSLAASGLTGKITGPGDLTLHNDASGAVTVSGSNQYIGHTYLTGGTFIASGPTAFGDAMNGTTIQSGTLTVQAATDEEFTVQAGATLSLASALATYNHAVTLDGGTLILPSSANFVMPIVAASDGGTVQFPSSAVTWTGGSTGPGDLRLNGAGSININSALLHQGGLTINQAKLNVANGYHGDTVVRGNSELNHVDGFGTSPTVTIQNSAQLTLNAVPSSDPNFVVDNGTLAVANFARRINGSLTLKNNSLIRGQAIYNGSVQLQATSGSTILQAGTFNGVMSGAGNVDLAGRNDLPTDNNNVTINGENTYTGTTHVDGIVNANTSQALGATFRGTVVGTNGVLNIDAPSNEPILVTPQGIVNVNARVSRIPQLAQDDSPTVFRGTQTVVLNVPGTFGQHYDVNEGVLQIKANTSIDSLTVRNDGQLIVSNGVLTTHADIGLEMGEVEGSIIGAPAIRKTTNEFAQLGELPGFDGDVIVEKGVLQIDSGNALGTRAGSTRVEGNRDAVLIARGETTIQDDIFLNNASGIDGTGG